MTHVQTDLEYLFNPSEFFESEEVIHTPQGTLRIGSGKAVFTLPKPIEVNHKTAKQYTEIVQCIFSTRQIRNHIQYELQGPAVVHHGQEGERDSVISAETGIAKATGYPVDIRFTDTSGKVTDTRADRIAHDRKYLQDIASKIPTSPILRGMITSYSGAVNDPKNELVHLFEILDALIEHFGKEEIARKKLAITKSEWDRIGKLANHEEILEGRHRGRKTSLRPATDVELHTAREMAMRIIKIFADKFA